MLLKKPHFPHPRGAYVVSVLSGGLVEIGDPMMNVTPELLSCCLSAAESPVWVAYSGGMDSRVLLQLAVDAGLNASGRLKAVHIHHGLQSEADGWAEHCRAVCAQLGVELQVHRVAVAAGDSLENQARAARYRVFEALLQDGGWLLQGHHADDQAETLLLRLMRGSGVRGLGAIPQRRSLAAGQLFRPLLGCRLSQLQCYAEQQRLRWIDDPSNADPVHDRNYLRLQVLPQLSQRWPAAVSSLNRSAGYCADASRLGDDLAAIDLVACQQSSGGLSIDGLLELADYRRSNLLRYWIYRSTAELVGEALVGRLWREVAGARGDAQPLLKLATTTVRRFDGALYLVVDPEPVSQPLWSWSVMPGECAELRLPGGLLRGLPVVGEGLAVSASAELQIRLRQGGERIRLPGRDGSRSVKKLLQQHRVPPWLRQQLPLIYAGDQLLAVADLWLADGCQARPGQAGIALRWQPSGLPLRPMVEGDF